jgi:hypothetical protein
MFCVPARNSKLSYSVSVVQEYCTTSDCDQALLDKRAYLREYALRKKDTIREYKRNYYNQNKDNTVESKREYDRLYSKANKDSMRAYIRKYNTRNKDKLKYSIREYVHRNKENIRDYIGEYHNGNCLFRTDSNNYPRKTSRKSWKTPEVVRDYFESMKRQLLIVNYTDWYRISRTQLVKLGGAYSLMIVSHCLILRIRLASQVRESWSCIAICIS